MIIVYKLQHMLKSGSIWAAVIVVSMADELGVPHNWQLVFNGIAIGWVIHAWGSAYASSMLEPVETDSRVYIQWFRFVHIIFHRGTAYSAHPVLWKLLHGEITDREVRKTDG